MLWLIGPVLIGVAVNQINTIVDRTIASTLVEGSISALNYATKLKSICYGDVYSFYIICCIPYVVEVII